MHTAGRGYAVQQALGAEAAAALRQAASLARRRGDARVNPLHVASAMLSAPVGLFRAACLQSQSHPLQHEALELRLHAALNRLPMAWPTAAMFHRGPTALSNALIAALKRALARQRSQGSADGALGQSAAAELAVKDVEIEQLVISILDDPNVDRAMHEAGYSSSQVKANVEKIYATSLEQSGSAHSGTTPCQTDSELLCPVVVDPERNLTSSFGYHIHSGDKVSQAIVGGTEVVTATASLPSWLRCHQAPILTRSTQLQGTNLHQAACHRPKFTELTAENLKIMCNALDLRIPRKDIAAGIATAVLLCRSGMKRRRSSATSSATSTWLLFHGENVHVKKAMAQELANLVFGSRAELASFGLTASSAMAYTGSSSSSRKRKRSYNNESSYAITGIRLLSEAILENPHRVMWIDGIELLDHETEIVIKNVIREGRIVGCDGRVVSLEDSIVVLSSQVLDCTMTRHEVKQRSSKQCREEDVGEEEEETADDAGIMSVVDGVFSFD